MGKRVILAISGMDCVGKSTLAEKLGVTLSCRGLPIKRAAFARALREMVAKRTGLSLASLWQKPTPEYIRKVLISEGAKILENDPYTFANIVSEWIMGNNEESVTIIDDMRYVRELETLRNNPNFSLLHIHIKGGYNPDRPYNEQCKELEKLADFCLPTKPPFPRILISHVMKAYSQR